MIVVVARGSRAAFLSQSHRPSALFSSQRVVAFPLRLWSGSSNSEDQSHGEASTNDNDKTREYQSIYERKKKELDDASTLSLAPMMEYTDRHFRHLVRLISANTLVYTEMVGASAIYHEQMDAKAAYQQQYPNADPAEINAKYHDKYLQRFLRQASSGEGPSVLQLGGSDPEAMYHATRTVMELTQRGHCDYTAINLNCGCPSPKVAGKGCFGAALMDDPKLVAELTQAIHDGCDGRLPVTVKCRIGTDSHQAFTKQAYAEHLDEEQEYATLCNFIETVASTGVVTSFDVHARIAVLGKSFSPADNRKIPPLKYNVVRRLVEDYAPDLQFTLNGGIETMAQAQQLLQTTPKLQGVMIGRAWAADPWRFAMADPLLYNSPTPAATNRLEILKQYGRHADYEETQWDPAKIRRFVTKAVTPLFAGEPNSKQYRIRLDEIARIPKQLQKEGKSFNGQPPISELILNTALECLSEEVLLRTPQETYERFQRQEEQSSKGVHIPGRAHAVQQWQTDRKQQQQAQEAV